MALIPLTYKLDWFDPSQPGGNISTLNNNANTATSYDTQYTMQDVVDTVGSSVLPYTVISQIISQTGTNDPTVDRELENTTGTTFTWQRFSGGVYRITAADPVFNFPFRTQVFLNIGNVSLPGPPMYISHGVQNDTTIEINTWDVTTLAQADTGLQFASFEAHIYPV